MALTLEEASKLSSDMLLQGVVETVVKDSPVLQQLPFIEIVGNGLTYNRENTLPTIDFYEVGDIWAESTPTFEQCTATLKMLTESTRSRSSFRTLEHGCPSARMVRLRFSPGTTLSGSLELIAMSWPSISTTMDLTTSSGEISLQKRIRCKRIGSRSCRMELVDTQLRSWEAGRRSPSGKP